MATKNKLKKLSVDEVSLVRRPMNPSANVLLFKRALDPAGEPGNVRHKENDMTDKEKAELEARLKKNDEALARATSMATMTDAQKVFLNSLAKEKQDEFLGLETGKRDAFVKANTKVIDDGEVIKIGDQTIRKSEVGDAMFSIVKAQQAMIETVTTVAKTATDVAKTATEALEKASVDAEAEKLWPNLSGTAADKGTILKSIRAMPKPQADIMMASQNAANAAIGKSFNLIGERPGSPSGGEGTPLAEVQSELTRLVKAVMEKDGLDEPHAMTKVLKENPALYTAYDQLTKVHAQQPRPN